MEELLPQGQRRPSGAGNSISRKTVADAAGGIGQGGTVRCPGESLMVTRGAVEKQEGRDEKCLRGNRGRWKGKGDRGELCAHGVDQGSEALGPCGERG